MQLTEEEIAFVHEPCDKVIKTSLQYIDMLKERLESQEKFIAHYEQIINNQRELINKQKELISNLKQPE